MPSWNYRQEKEPLWWFPVLLEVTGIVLAFICAALLLIALAAQYEPAYGQEIELKITPNPAHPGDLILLELKGWPMNDKSFAWTDNQGIDMFWYKDRFIGLGAVSLNEAAGIVKIWIRMRTRKDSFQIHYDLKVEPKEWPERRVGETPPLGPRKMARYLKEKALIKKALETTAEEPLWQKYFLPPVYGMEATSPFGQKRIGPTKTRKHRGVDLRAPVGSPIYAMNSGRMVLTGNFMADGKIVIIDHGLGLHTLYLHLSRIKVKRDQMVKRGQIIGLSGSTGFSEGPHLHLEVRLNSEPVNPLQILEILKEERP